MMLVILAVAVSLYFATAAWRAYRFRTPHLHIAILDDGGNPATVTGIHSEPFWPAFFRQATGLAVGKGCSMDGTMVMEMCELANPEIRIPSALNSYVPKFTNEQLEHFARLSRDYWARWDVKCRKSRQREELRRAALIVWFVVFGPRSFIAYLEFGH